MASGERVWIAKIGMVIGEPRGRSTQALTNVGCAELLVELTRNPP